MDKVYIPLAHSTLVTELECSAEATESGVYITADVSRAIGSER